MKRTSEFASANAVALTLVGISAGWLALNMGRQRRTQAASRASGRAVAPSRDARELVSEYPMAVGALAVAAGVGMALAFPQTEVENRLMSPVARGLKDQARGLIDHVRADIRTAQEAAGALRESMTRPADA